ncbi:MAG: thiamine-phosphate kinase, partial [Proteobacteria bacterium]|nr:thiamine-phosphate kinase [Pseudomonadota bacterium]
DLVLSMTMLGRVERDSELRRGGAQPGDTLYVSGTIGDAGIGLRATRGELPDLDPDARAFFLDRLLHPSPRLRLGRALVAVASAAIDVSDGLLADLGHLCEQSGVAATIRLDDVPISPHAAELGGDGMDRLSSGEDYELLFTAPTQQRDAIAGVAGRLGIAITAIGAIAEGVGVRVVDADGNAIAVERGGYTHF